MEIDDQIFKISFLSLFFPLGTVAHCPAGWPLLEPHCHTSSTLASAPT